jgi:hypothetical protein
MKKRSAILILALLLTLLVTVSSALAQDRPVRVSGEIIARDDTTGQLTVKPRYRDAITVQTSAETDILRKICEDGLEPIAFEDLMVGDQVTAAGIWEGDVLQARRVTVKSACVPPPDTVHGAISVLNASNGTITVEPKTGDTVLVHTSQETEFYRETQRARREPIAFTDLAVGDWVRVQGAWVDEDFEAERVTVMPFRPAPPPRLVMGSIGELLSGSDFSLEHQRREPITVKTTDTTKFYRTLQWGRLEPIGFGDLVAGDWVAVLGRWGDGEALNADAVTVMRGHGAEAEGVLEIGDVLEAGEVVEETDSSQVQP